MFDEQIYMASYEKRIIDIRRITSYLMTRVCCYFIFCWMNKDKRFRLSIVYFRIGDQFNFDVDI